MLSISNIKAQAENINTAKYHPAKEHFETKYHKQEYSKYLKSQVKLEEGKVIIDKIKIIEFPESIDDESKLILENGFLDPMKINGSLILKISKINELTLLNPNSQTKRFSFWIFKNIMPSSNKGILRNRINPDEYYFELQNENANKNTSFKDFVVGAKLTYLSFGTIII